MPVSDEGERAEATSVFDATAERYDEARRRLIPCYDGFYGAALEWLPFDGDERLRVVDLGAGTGLLSALVAARYPRAEITLIDGSEEMLSRARSRLGDDGRFRFVLADLAAPPLPDGNDAAISALAIHHLEDDGKRQLYARVRAALRSGGVFVNAEQVAGPTPALHRRYHERWREQTRALGASEQERADSELRMREDRPATVEAQLEWLRELGFSDVDCPFRSGMFAVFGGRAS